MDESPTTDPAAGTNPVSGPDRAPATGSAPLNEPPTTTEALQTIERRNWTRNIAIAVTASLLLIGLGWGAGAIANQFATPASELALIEVQDAADAREQHAQTQGGTEGTIYWSEQLAEAVLQVRGVPEPAADQEYYVWYLRDDVPVRVGNFRPAGGAEAGYAVIELDQVWLPGDELVVSLESSEGLSPAEPSDEQLFTIDEADEDTEPSDDDEAGQ